MNLSPGAQEVYHRIHDATKLGDIKKLAKEIKKDHELAMELWSTAHLIARKLAVLIMDKKLLKQQLIDQLVLEMQVHTQEEQNGLMEWLMANQLMKDKQATLLINSWDKSPSALQRRTFWYYQARLRWTGQAPPNNTQELLDAIEVNMPTEDPIVQWAMNFTAGWIGVYDSTNRKRCIAIGIKTGLFKDEVIARGCTPNYLPAFIDTEVKKRAGK
ncbi:MAG: DNA alkylation repair protein [Cytophagales bacterium]|nr:DNA alkylation repair protein [Cytophagales bacterium]